MKLKTQITLSFLFLQEPGEIRAQSVLLRTGWVSHLHLSADCGYRSPLIAIRHIWNVPLWHVHVCACVCVKSWKMFCTFTMSWFKAPSLHKFMLKSRNNSYCGEGTECTDRTLLSRKGLVVRGAGLRTPEVGDSKAREGSDSGCAEKVRIMPGAGHMLLRRSELPQPVSACISRADVRIWGKNTLQL